jgi:hypothetical protein
VRIRFFVTGSKSQSQTTTINSDTSSTFDKKTMYDSAADMLLKSSRVEEHDGRPDLSWECRRLAESGGRVQIHGKIDIIDYPFSVCVPRELTDAWMGSVRPDCFRCFRPERGGEHGEYQERFRGQRRRPCRFRSLRVIATSIPAAYTQSIEHSSVFGFLVGFFCRDKNAM